MKTQKIWRKLVQNTKSKKLCTNVTVWSKVKDRTNTINLCNPHNNICEYLATKCWSIIKINPAICHESVTFNSITSFTINQCRLKVVTATTFHPSLASRGDFRAAACGAADGGKPKLSDRWLIWPREYAICHAEPPYVTREPVTRSRFIQVFDKVRKRTLEYSIRWLTCRYGAALRDRAAAEAELQDDHGECMPSPIDRRRVPNIWWLRA